MCTGWAGEAPRYVTVIRLAAKVAGLTGRSKVTVKPCDLRGAVGGRGVVEHHAVDRRDRVHRAHRAGDDTRAGGDLRRGREDLQVELAGLRRPALEQSVVVLNRAAAGVEVAGPDRDDLAVEHGHGLGLAEAQVGLGVRVRRRLVVRDRAQRDDRLLLLGRRVNRRGAVEGRVRRVAEGRGRERRAAVDARLDLGGEPGVGRIVPRIQVRDDDRARRTGRRPRSVGSASARSGPPTGRCRGRRWSTGPRTRRSPRRRR